jgi:hypothetical protein
MKAEIVELKSGGEVVLSYDGKPINPARPLWHREAVKDRVRPAAFLVDGPAAALEVTVRIPGLKEAAAYKLEGFYDPDYPLFSGSSLKKETHRERAVFALSARFRPDGFFRMTGKGLCWQVTDSDSGESGELGPIDLELYWLYGDDHELFQQGIPLEILREVAGTCGFSGPIRAHQLDKERAAVRVKPGKSPTPPIEWVIKRVVRCCFRRNPPRYDTREGENHFTIINGRDWDHVTLLLRKYLQAKHDPQAVCNCYDLAAVLQCYLRAIGIGSVHYCYMKNFGFMKAARLMGRALCNNPLYSSSQNRAPLVDETDADRTYFNNHAFCYLADYDWVVDACIGPHSQKKNPSRYVKAAVDTDYPAHAGVLPGTPEDIEYFTTGVSRLNYTVGLETLPAFPHLDAFMDRVNWSAQSNNTPADKVVVCPWPDPIDQSGCPIRKKDGWWLFFRDVIPGSGQVTEIWKLQREEEMIDINLYVAGRENEFARLRFLVIGSLRSHPRLHYQRGPDYLGHCSAVSTIGDRSRYLWVFHNVVFDVIFYNTTVEPKKLLTWLNRLAVSHVKDSAAADLPSLDAVTCAHTMVAKGETLRVDIKPQADVEVYFNLLGGGLRLIDKEDEFMLFKALRESENSLFILPTNKKTLLNLTKKIQIEVRPPL